jgi:hypothetical protein
MQGTHRVPLSNEQYIPMQQSSPPSEQLNALPPVLQVLLQTWCSSQKPLQQVEL